MTISYSLKTLLVFVGFITLGITVGCQSDASSSLNSNQTTSKKGVGIHYSNPNWPQLVTLVAPHWHYHWGRTNSEFQPQGIEFVPMMWTIPQNSADSEETLKQGYQSQQFNTLLGFNEPDKSNQANLSVEQAIAYWQQLEQIGAPLVSPATVAFDNAWMQSFMAQAKSSGLKIDYLAIHWYSNPNPNNFLNTIDRAYQMYGLPIWITEFAVADWSMPNGVNRWSENDVISFMKIVLPELDKRDYVAKYAWFNGKTPQLATSALFNPDQTLTKLGKVYRNHNPNKIAEVPHLQPYIIDQTQNLLNNGNFEQGKNIGWQMHRAHIATFSHTNIEEGYLAIRLKNALGSITQTINNLNINQVHSNSLVSKRYKLSFMAKGNTNDSLLIQFNQQDEINNSTFNITTDWQLHTFIITDSIPIDIPLDIKFTNLGEQVIYLDGITLIEEDEN